MRLPSIKAVIRQRHHWKDTPEIIENLIEKNKFAARQDKHVKEFRLSEE